MKSASSSQAASHSHPRRLAATLSGNSGAPADRHSGTVPTDYFSELPIGMMWVGADGTVERANHAQLELLGRSAGEVVGQHVAELHAEPSAIGPLLVRLAQGATLHNYHLSVLSKSAGLDGQPSRAGR